MKKKAMGCWIAAALLALSACGAQEKPQEDAVVSVDNALVAEAAQAYDAILDSVYDLIVNGYKEGSIYPFTLGIEEATFDADGAEGLKRIGYLIQDISGDGIPELLLGCVAGEDGQSEDGSVVLAVYTYADGQPVCTLEGWSRNSYRWLGDGEFFNQGSNGAMYSIFGTYQLSEDGTELACTSYYFTHEKDDTFEEIGLYYNTSGEWDTSVSEEFTQSEEEFWAIETDLIAQVQPLAWTSLAEYAPAQEQTASAVRADYAENILPDASGWDVVALEGDEGQVDIAFVGDGTVNDFRILSLFLDDVAEDGTPTFTTMEIYQTERLDSEHPLVVGMTFYGDIPNYGISYTDESGETKYYALQMSGEDESIQLVAF